VSEQTSWEETEEGKECLRKQKVCKAAGKVMSKEGISHYSVKGFLEGLTYEQRLAIKVLLPKEIKAMDDV
jgi:hypothetical protein